MNRRPLVGLLLAETVSLAGSRMSMIALPWFTLVITGSPARTGVVAFAEMLPYVLACALGGPLIDRIGARRMSIGADVISGVVVAAVPLLHGAGLLGFGTFAALVAAAGLARGFGDTSKRVVFPETVAASGLAMTRATSLHDGLNRLAGLLGAPLAGLLIAALDAPAVLALDAATFAVAALLVAVLVPLGRSARADVSEDREPYLVAIRGGLRFLRRDRLILGMLIMLFVTNLADTAYGGVIGPVWARDVVASPVALGFLSASFATGAVLGNVVFTAVATKVPRFPVFAVGFLLAGSPRFVVLAVADRPWVVYGVSFVAGVSIAAVNPIIGALSYERIPKHLHARVLGLSHALAWAGIPLGGLLGGLAVDQLRLSAAALLFGAAYLAVTLVPFLDPSWRGMDRKGSEVADSVDGGDRGDRRGGQPDQVLRSELHLQPAPAGGDVDGRELLGGRVDDGR
mgnify:CR=1 FL=1